MHITEVLPSETDDQIAIIKLSSGHSNTPTWSSLHDYWSYADPDEVEYIAISYTSDKLVLCCTVASGQGGIIAVWDVVEENWVHASEANYVASALLLADTNNIISLHYISYYGVPARHEVYITPITGVLDGTESISKQLAIDVQESGFNPKNHSITQSALGDYSENEHGPLGIFYSKEENVIYAHDAGNLFTIDASTIT